MADAARHSAKSAAATVSSAVEPSPKLSASAVTAAESTASCSHLRLATPPRSTRDLALYNYRLGFFNLVSNWANMHRTKYLESAVHRGREQIDILSAEVRAQHGELDALSEGLDQVSGELGRQKQQMGTALEEFSAQVSRQNDRIQKQQRAMERMLASKLQSDAIVDTSIMAVSGWFSATPIMSLPVYLLTMWLPYKTRRIATNLLRLAAFFKMVATLRTAAIERGVHNAVGTPSLYIATAIAYVTKKTKQRMATENMRGGERGSRSVGASGSDIEGGAATTALCGELE